MKKPPLLRTLVALSACAFLLAGCGGGGGGGDTTSNGIPPIPSTTALGPSAQYQESVAGCSLDTQKKFVRSYLDEVYFWYNEIVDVDRDSFATVEDYFDALLVRTPDVNGLPKDRFSAIIPAANVKAALSQSFATQQADTTSLQSNHTGFVPQTKVVTTGGGRTVGYIDFRDHDLGAQDDLITAFQQLKTAGVQDLILDLRLNSGGFLYIALSTASMITGPASNGKVFEQLHYNNKRPAETAASTLLFSDRVQFADQSSTGVTQYPQGTPLPQLGLPRVFILTTGRTCSASESIINSLRGIGVQVVRIGTTTCGKPYGFRERDNCGLAYFPIEFQGTNAQGFGDYTNGFAPFCEITDTRATDVLPGDTTRDPLMVGAMFYVDNNACPGGTATGVQSASVPHLLPREQPTRPSWAGRLLLPSQQH